MLGPALDVAQSKLGHFGVRVGAVRRHLRGGVLPSVDLAQDVSQHEVPLPPPARSGCYAAQHGLLDPRSGRGPWSPASRCPRNPSLLELPLELGAVVGVHVAGPQGLEFFMPAAVVLARRPSAAPRPLFSSAHRWPPA